MQTNKCVATEVCIIIIAGCSTDFWTVMDYHLSSYCYSDIDRAIYSSKGCMSAGVIRII